MTTLGGGRTPEQLGQARPYTVAELVGNDLSVETLVEEALGRPGPDPIFDVVSYSFGSPATGGLYRLRGDDWSLFCKVLQHPKHWPMLPMLPPDVREGFLDGFPWRIELDL